MKRRPAAILYLCALMGALLGYHAAFGTWFLLSAILIVGIAMLITEQVVRIFCVLLFTFLITAFVTSTAKSQFDERRAAIPSNEAVFFGTVKKVSKKEDGSIAIIARSFVTNDEQKRGVNLLIRLKKGLANRQVMYGQDLLFKAEVHPFTKKASPVFFDAIRFGFAHNIHGSVTISDESDLWLGEIKETSLFDAQRSILRERLTETLTPREASLLLALIIGDTDLFSDEQSAIYKTIGAQHLLAVSGLQVSTLAMLCFLFLSPIFALLFPRSLYHRIQACAAIVTVFVTFCFVGMTNFQSSAIRALLMAICMLLPALFARKVDLFDAFFCSGLITILVFPESIMDIGYLLSYAVVFGLLLTQEENSLIRKNLEKHSWFFALCISLFLSAAAAFLSSLPVLSLFFHTIAPYSVFANLFLVPIAALLQIPAIILGLVGGFCNWPHLISIASFFSNCIEILAEALALVFGKIAYLPNLSTSALFSGSLGLLIIFLAIMHRSRPLGFCALFLMVWPCSEMLIIDDHLTAIVIPVGHGDATLFMLPDGKRILIDAGGSVNGNFDPGNSIVLPTLKRYGVTALDTLVISHPDPDHILGAFSIIAEIPVKEIWHSGFNNEHLLTKRLNELAFQKNIPIKSAMDILGSHKFGAIKIEVLGPMASSNEQFFAELPANDNSLVLRFVYGKNALLWPGDLEYFGENLLISKNLNLSSQVLKAPHHGSKTSSSPEFLSAVNPKYVICSTGSDNRFKFPNQEVIERYQNHGALLWNTEVDGELVIRVNEKEITIDGYRRLFKEKTRSLPSISKTIG